MKAGMLLYLGVEGYNADGTLVIPTVWAMCGAIEKGANTGDDLSSDPTLPVWGQLQAQIEQLNQVVIPQEMLDEIQDCANSATQAALQAARSKESAAASSSLASDYVNTARNSADLAHTYAENADTSANSAANLANGALQAQRAAEAAAERAEAAAVSAANVELTVDVVNVGEDSGGDDDSPVAVTGLSLDLTSYNAKVGGGFYINPVVLPANATNRSVTWQSDNPAVATVNAMGYVECIAEGAAVITCTTEDGGFTATCAVSVAAAESGGGDSGDGNGGETTGQKIQFSTLERTAGGIKADGTAHTLGGTFYITIPYSEGMYIRTLYGSWDVSTYPAILVLTDGVYSTPAYNNGVTDNDGSTNESIGGKTPYHVDATLTGYAAGSSVIVNMLIGSATGTQMDNRDWTYYIPRGES